MSPIKKFAAGLKAAAVGFGVALVGLTITAAIGAGLVALAPLTGGLSIGIGGIPLVGMVYESLKVGVEVGRAVYDNAVKQEKAAEVNMTPRASR